MGVYEAQKENARNAMLRAELLTQNYAVAGALPDAGPLPNAVEAALSTTGAVVPAELPKTVVGGGGFGVRGGRPSMMSVI